MVSTHTLPALALVLVISGCGCTRQVAERPYAAPTADSLLGYLETASERARAFQAESVMDYWVGGERVKGTVLVMGERGAKIRFNALSPAGDTVAADLACDGEDFAFIDYNANCQLTGPCTEDSIARLLRVSLEPDDFLLLSLGLVPILEDARAELSWDEDAGAERLVLTGPEGRQQTILLDRQGELWEVVSSTRRTPAGEVAWQLQNKEFTTVRGEGGTPLRVPERTRFEQPSEDADLAVRWRERTINPSLDEARFEMAIPAGLPRC